MADVWSDNVSDVLPIADESMQSSFVARKGMKAMLGDFENSGMDQEETYTSISSTTSSSDAMLDAQIELAQARKAEASANADLARLKVAKAAKKASSTSSGQSNERSRSARFDQQVFTPPKGRVDHNVQDRSPVLFSAMHQLSEAMPRITEPCDDLERDLSAFMEESVNGKGISTANPSLLPRPPTGVEVSEVKPEIKVPTLELNAEVLKEFARRQEESENRIRTEALEFQQRVLREAEEQVLRLQSALSAEAEGNFVNAANAEQRLAYVEQFASERIAAAEGIIISEAAERRAVTERAEKVMRDANTIVLNAQERQMVVEAEAFQYAERVKAEANQEVQNAHQAVHVQSLNAMVSRQEDQKRIEAYIQGVESGKQEFKAHVEREVSEQHKCEINELKHQANELHQREIDALTRKASAEFFDQEENANARIRALEADRQRWHEEASLREASRDAEFEQMKRKQDDLMRMLIEERTRAATPIVLSPSPREERQT
jgi:hypothetical protein